MKTRHLTAALLLGASLSAGAQGQAGLGSSGSRTAPNQPQSPAPTSEAELASEAFRLQSVGLSIRLPVGSNVHTTGGGDRFSARVDGPGNTWLINIQTPVIKDTQRSVDAIARDVRDRLLASVAPLESRQGQGIREGASRAVVIQDIHPIEISAAPPEERRPGLRFYVRLPRGEREAPIVRGYTIFLLGPGRFTTFDLVVPEPEFPAAKSAYEASLSTVRFADASQLAASRGIIVEAGINLIESLSPEDYQAALSAAKDQYFRLSRPAVDGAGDQEIAYRRIRAWNGRRGEIDPTRPAQSYRAQETQEGYLVRIDARSLQDGKTIDSIGTFFMSKDRREEAWLLQMVVLDPATRKPATWREIGVREGDRMSVATDGSGESKATQPTVPDRGYVNQVETFLLPQIIAQSASKAGAPQPAEFGFYAYQSNSGRVQLRRDSLRPAEGEPAGWSLTTHLHVDRPPQHSRLSPQGHLLRSELPEGGGVWTPITLDRLAELWRSKGLPMK